jgi:hypothetical protein
LWRFPQKPPQSASKYRMGCGASSSTRYAAPPSSGAAAGVRESYEKTLLSPGGTITKALGFAIDASLPARTPGGGAAARRDYDRDPLTYEEVAAIEAARERRAYFAGTPKLLASSWRKIVLQAPGPSTPAAEHRPGLSVWTADGEPTGVPDLDEPPEDDDDLERDRTESGRREIRVPLVRRDFYTVPSRPSAAGRCL